ncbi:hypothetical protein [Flavobacterium daemonense]|uniref:hypothetical protein n=1 Tax=Flavobacterium daemonense TaxID=1393049 RepID=UPI0011848DA4|nr:hypothetical protein [Flavobacterium daemonense]KAF2337019.1 hypothetical protein FND99_01030 [Flavobacterium daemonense]
MMNPFNLLINYVIANSRASFYNVSGNQEITNTALLAGVVSENPLVNYLIIENKAKIEGDKFNVSEVPATTASAPGLPAPSTAPIVNPPTSTETPVQTSGTAPADIVTLQNVRNEISISNNLLKEEIAKITASNNAELTKALAEKFEVKIALLEKNTAALNDAILEIKNRIEAISKSISFPDSVLSQKAPAKNEKK